MNTRILNQTFRGTALRWLIGLLVLLLGVPGCGNKGPQFDQKPTAVVSGRVTIDGQPPGSPVQVHCHPVDGIDQEHPSVSHCLTENDGSFKLSTYSKGDGVPAGEYVLTFMHGTFNVASMSYGGPDRLNKRYSDPQKSEIKLSVTGSEPVDLGVIELTTK